MTDTVTLPRAVVEQTLDALKSAKHRITEAGGTGWKLSAQGCTNSITALREALSQPIRTAQHLNMVPPGWKLVPVEPTPEMIDAARSQSSFPVSVYRAMLDATPQPPGVEQPQVEQEPFAVLARKRSWHHDTWVVGPSGNLDYGKSWADERINVYTHPQPRQPLTDEQITTATGANPGTPLWLVAVSFARAIERAHHIGDEK